MKAGKRLTPKQETFCRAMASADCNGPSEAYRRAYNCDNMKPTTIKRNAQALLSNTNITATINKLREKADEAVVYTENDIFNEIDEAIARAYESGNVAVVMKGIELKGKIKGHFTDKKEVKHEGGISIMWGDDGD